jgi:hypothetical protein
MDVGDHYTFAPCRTVSDRTGVFTMILPQLDFLDYVARLGQLVDYVFGMFLALSILAAVLYMIAPLVVWFQPLRRWQYRVDVSTLGRIVVTRYFDGRVAAGRFIRHWRRIPQAVVAVHGERWT